MPFDPNEIERYGETTLADAVAIIAGMCLLIIGTALVVWNPDVEAIGTWVWNALNGV